MGTSAVAATMVLQQQDAHAWLRDYTGPPFDVIIMDIADPIEAGPG
jgi:spermidine synthase